MWRQSLHWIETILQTYSLRRRGYVRATVCQMLMDLNRDDSTSVGYNFSARRQQPLSTHH